MSPEEIAQRISRIARNPNPESALAAIEPGIHRFPPDPGIALSLSELYLAARCSNEALAWADRALALGMDHWRARLQRGVCALETGDRAGAKADALLAARQATGDPTAQCLCGAILSRLGAQDEALACYREAAHLRPWDTAILFSIASIERFLGRLDAAEQYCNQALELNPDEFEAYLLRSGLRRMTRQRNHIPELRKRLSAPLPDAMAEAQLCYALAKELEDCARYAESFTCLHRGAAVRRKLMDYDPRRELAVIDELISRCNTRTLAPSPSSRQGAGAVFIVGLPRSGSTLLERLLCAHSRISSAGELPDFPRLLSPGPATADPVEAALAMDPEALGRNYLAGASAQRAAHPFVIDKLPLNFLNVGLIHRALPGSQIIHIHREPMDSCYAMYKTLFRSGYPFSYDLNELAQYYLAYRRLMTHWHTVLPGRIIEVNYEAMVSDPETVVAGVLARLGLAWEQQLADFHCLPLPSTTASASQVREPVHQRSVGLWRRYREQLQPLEQRLMKAGMLGACSGDA